MTEETHILTTFVRGFSSFLFWCLKLESRQYYVIPDARHNGVNDTLFCKTIFSFGIKKRKQYILVICTHSSVFLYSIYNADYIITSENKIKENVANHLVVQMQA